MVYNMIYGGSSRTLSATSTMMMTIMTTEHLKLYLHHHSKSQRVLCDVILATFAWCSSTFCILCLKRQIAVVRHCVALCKTQIAVNKLDEQKSTASLVDRMAGLWRLHTLRYFPECESTAPCILRLCLETHFCCLRSILSKSLYCF